MLLSLPEVRIIIPMIISQAILITHLEVDIEATTITQVHHGIPITIVSVHGVWMPGATIGDMIETQVPILTTG